MDISTKTGVSAIVEFDYTAKESDEIDLIKGAIIQNIKIQPGGWWEGTLTSNGKIGMFPDNFVRVLDTSDEKGQVILRDKSATVHRKCKVVYSYTQNNEDELSLAVGDIIEVIGEVEEGWWRGKLNNKIGVFPSNFVVPTETSPILANRRSSSILNSTTTANSKTKENRISLHSSKEDLLSNSISSNSLDLSKDKDAPLLPPKPIREFCRVMYPYEPQNEDELELNTDEIITVLTKDLPDKGWWRGELRGKVGVFPDNFVVLLPPEVSPSSKDSNSVHPDRPPSSGTGSGSGGNNIGLSGSSINSSKVFIKKSGSGSSSQSQNSNRKDSFGSRDSLNDILSETGLQSGNVAAQRKSLENKKLDLTAAPATTAGTTTAPSTNDSSTTGGAKISKRNMDSSASTKNSELRKSIENIDDKNKTPPPVLTKKPIVPVKKSTSVTSVAGNLLSGFKQKVKNVEQKLSTNQTGTSLDSADGIGCSRMSSNGQQQVADTNERNIIGERIIRNSNESGSDFDNVERSSILPDMRAGRVKAPKRRPPSAAINVIGETNNNNSIYLNGTSSNYAIEHNNDLSGISGANVGAGDEELAKPKPREWEKKKAPWMAELKASQEKKKTSPNVEPKAMDRTKIGESINSSSATVAADRHSTSSIDKIENASARLITSVQRRSAESSSGQQATTTAAGDMTKSMSSHKSQHTNQENGSNDDVKLRPNSLSIRNRSVSPIGRTSLHKATSLDVQNVRGSQQPQLQQQNSISSTSKPSAVTSSTIVQNSSASSTTSATTTAASTINSLPVSHENVCNRVVELEMRVNKLESIVQSQNKLIDELMKSLREEKDNVKGLKTELDKYAQCVTQV